MIDAIVAAFPYWFWGLGLVSCALALFVMRIEYVEEQQEYGSPQRLRDLEFLSRLNRRT